MPSGQKTNIFFKGDANIFSVSLYHFSAPCLNVIIKNTFHPLCRLVGFILLSCKNINIMLAVVQKYNS